MLLKSIVSLVQGRPLIDIKEWGEYLDPVEVLLFE